MVYTLKKQLSGALAVHNPAMGETMHPRLGPWEEANRLYVAGAGLAGLLAGRGGEVVLFDVGLGAAANALAAVACHEDLLLSDRRARPLRIVSFENDLEPVEFALASAARLGYLQGREPVLEALLEEGQWGSEGIAWELRLGDFTRLIEEEPRRADLVFFDPFSPRANPAMWSLPTLEAVYRCRRPGAPMRLFTYSSAMATRAALLLAGFYVGSGPGLGGARRATEAASEFSVLAAPLEPRWLGRWKKERDPWPCLTPPKMHRRLRGELLAHPQWNHFEPAAPSHNPRRGREAAPAAGGKNRAREAAPAAGGKNRARAAAPAAGGKNRARAAAPAAGGTPPRVSPKGEKRRAALGEPNPRSRPARDGHGRGGSAGGRQRPRARGVGG